MARTGLLIAVVCLVSLGCGDSGYPLTEVTGKVTFNGAPPPKPGHVSFRRVRGTGGGVANRPGSASFGEDGEFTAQTFAPGDGLLPGTYKVQVICLSGDPSTGSFEKLSYVPMGWAPEDLVIEEGQDPVRLEYNVPSKSRK